MSEQGGTILLKFMESLAEQLTNAENAIGRVVNLHEDSGLGTCSHCSYRPYPCPTILALEVPLNE